MPIPVAVRCKA